MAAPPEPNAPAYGAPAQAAGHAQPASYPQPQPQPGHERKPGSWDPLDELAVRVGTTLDPAITAQEVADLVVPGFADQASILLRESVLKGVGAAEPRDGSIRLIRLALSAWNSAQSDQLHAAWPVGALTIARDDSPYARAMRSRQVVVIKPAARDAEPVGRGAANSLGRTPSNGTTSADTASGAGAVRSPGDLPAPQNQARTVDLLEGCSIVYAPLVVGGRVLGVAVLSRAPHRSTFTTADIASIERLAARAAIWMDNARLHDQLRRTAISMQTAMLPTKMDAPAGLEIANRYLPGSDMAVVGGDWFDVISISGGRAALVVGDVMGHGTQAATVMGQLRTAVRTLAAVDLPPAEVLAHLDDLMPGIDGTLFATCVYAVYDPATQRCSISRAGHVPPIVVYPEGKIEVLHEVAPGLPLGLGGDAGTFETLEVDLPDGSLFVLCTDGLLENKARDIDSGLDLLRASLAEPARPLEEMCDRVIRELDLTKDRDDVALLIARTHPLPADRSAAWNLPGEAGQVPKIRGAVRRTLADWRLTELADTVELLVSELVTNAIQHAGGQVRLRLERGAGTLLCEVCDNVRSLPLLQSPPATAERGRGILLVSELSRTWGCRRTASGKVVWFTMRLPR